jgi:uncharacterized repeat protein (TIGR01451 family)
MNHRFTAHLAALAAVTLLLFGATQAFAGGTASGTDITNDATLDYTINSISQTQVNSNQVTFKVDKNVNLTVVQNDGALVQVTPGATDQVLTFTVTNTGNDTQDVDLSAIAESGGTANPFGAGSDNFDATVVGVFVEDGTNAGYQPGEDTATYIDELAPDAAETVYIVRDIDAAQADGDIAVYALVGEIRAGGSGGSEGAALTETPAGSVGDNTVDILFADGNGADDAAGDAKDSDRSGFQVVTATMTATKSQSITGGYAVPGATVTYDIQVDNTGSAQADSVIVTDGIPANTTYGAITACNGTPEWHLISSGVWTSTDPGNGSSDVDQIRCTIATVAASGSDTVSFTVTID